MGKLETRKAVARKPGTAVLPNLQGSEEILRNVAYARGGGVIGNVLITNLFHIRF